MKLIIPFLLFVSPLQIHADKKIKELKEHLTFAFCRPASSFVLLSDTFVCINPSRWLRYHSSFTSQEKKAVKNGFVEGFFRGSTKTFKEAFFKGKKSFNYLMKEFGIEETEICSLIEVQKGNKLNCVSIYLYATYDPALYGIVKRECDFIPVKRTGFLVFCVLEKQQIQKAGKENKVSKRTAKGP